MTPVFIDFYRQRNFLVEVLVIYKIRNYKLLFLPMTQFVVLKFRTCSAVKTCLNIRKTVIETWVLKIQKYNDHHMNIPRRHLHKNKRVDFPSRTPRERENK